VNSKTGVVDLATGIEIEGEELPKFIRPTEVQTQLTAVVALQDGTTVNIPEGEPTSVVVLWRQCRESRSMLLPFYEVRWKDYSLFLRVDGKFHASLTPTGGTPDRAA